MSDANFTDDSGAVRLRGRFGGGGSQPSVKWVDLGVVTAAGLVTGRTTLYTTGAGELLSAFRYGDALTFTDTLVVLFEAPGWTNDGQPVGAFDTSSIQDYAANAIFVANRAYFNGGVTRKSHASPGLVAGALTATLSDGTTAIGTTPGWQANHVYAAGDCAVIAVGHYWSGGGGTSGGSQPDFAGNIGGFVVDNDFSWNDGGPVPTAGSVHVYAEIVTPATP